MKLLEVTKKIKIDKRQNNQNMIFKRLEDKIGRLRKGSGAGIRKKWVEGHELTAKYKWEGH